MNEDSVLIKRTLRGEKEAFEMIIRKYQSSLLNYMSRSLGERELALDFTQDVFVKAYSSLHTYLPRYKFSTWLFKIASNSMIDFWRKKKIDALSIDQRNEDDDRPSVQVPDIEPTVCRKYEISQLREKIEAILERMAPPLRELFVLRHVNGFSYDEIAEIKGLPVGTIKNRVFQVKELIRCHLEREA